MGKNIVQKIFEAHRVNGETEAGSPIALKVDQVYTQDATGTMTWLEFEAIGIDRVRVPLAVSYVDHSMLQANFMSADDHLFLQTAARKFGAYFSKPGNGICHQIHLERFAAPGRIALGTDSHTPTGGGMGMIAIGVGGLEAATVMAGAPLEITMPKVVNVRLTGRLQKPYVSAMDIILSLLKRLTVKGGVGKIIEYGGPGVKSLTVTERATITNMGAELGATTSIFPSDEVTRAYLKAQGREADWMEMAADADAEYAEVITLNLGTIEPMIAQPHSPDNVVPLREVSGKRVNQVCIGSCTNSSYPVMKMVASVLKGRTVAEWVSLLINPGSKQVYEMLAREGLTADMIAAGARVLESSCGPCIGMGGAPGSGQVSVRSYNRNFQGRSGTKDAFVYLTSPLSCAIIALKGEIIDPRDAGIPLKKVADPKAFRINDNLLIPPTPDPKGVEVVKGPNIKEVPVKEPLRNEIEAEVLLKTGDNITTDDIMPAGSKVLPFRSNIPAISEFVFENIDKTFTGRAQEAKARGGSIIVGGENYGQGSSREHAAIAPMYLGLQAVIAKSFARIHRANLINFGILPLVFTSGADYERVEQGDRLALRDVAGAVKGGRNLIVEDLTKGFTFEVAVTLNDREKELIVKGGLLPYTKNN
ncbi:MAG: aconitate hydratase [Thermodesulfovibrionales bacterium]